MSLGQGIKSAISSIRRELNLGYLRKKKEKRNENEPYRELTNNPATLMKRLCWSQYVVSLLRSSVLLLNL